MGWGRRVGAVAVAVGAIATMVAPHDPPRARRLADLEFALRRGTSEADRAGVALAIWRTGVVRRVESDQHFRRVYLRQPGNLSHVELVRHTLEANAAVEDVESLTAIVSRTASR